MRFNGLDLLLLVTTGVLGYAAWSFARDARRAQRRAVFLTDLLAEKNTRLYTALAERDTAITHADDAQKLVNSMTHHPVGLTLITGDAS